MHRQYIASLQLAFEGIVEGGSTLSSLEFSDTDLWKVSSGGGVELVLATLQADGVTDAEGLDLLPFLETPRRKALGSWASWFVSNSLRLVVVRF